jgi:hypothetical protein
MWKGIRTMKLTILLAITTFIFAQNAYSGLNELINQNVKDSTKYYNKVLIEAEQQKYVPRLWIHVEREDQKKAVTDILEWFKSIKLGGKALELRPIKYVKSGPQVSQLRFFKEQDAKYAEQLISELEKILPLLELKDLSFRYKKIEWIKPGHFELWLSPDINNLKAP